MIFFTLKILLAAIIIAFASWLSGQNPKLAGFIIALPLVSLIAIAFSYYEHNDIEKTILFTKSRPHKVKTKILHRKLKHKEKLS